MIPERIALKGFLSYDRDEQVITFDGGSLWLLSGPNGSGKSSVFDAMTFALFGAYRGGKQDLHEAINKSCDESSVEFDFRLDGKSYRIRRTLKRKKGGGATAAQQVFQLAPGSNGAAGKYDAVPDTSRKSELDRWVGENVGLSYDSFTTSVLLVQGKADALLTADPRDRHQVLARIIGMEDYERLHGRAAEQARGFDARANVLQTQLDGIAEVSELALVEAEQAITDAEASLNQARDEMERLRSVETQAAEWARLQEATARISQQLQHAQGLLQREKEIERDAATLQELRAVLPVVRRAITQRDEQERAGKELVRLEKEQQQQADQQTAAADAIRQASQKCQQGEKTIETMEHRRREVMEELQSLASAVPYLRILHDSRESLRQAVQDAEKAERDLQDAKRDAEQRQAELDAIKEQLEPARQARAKADEDKVRMAARLEEIDKRIKRFASVSGEKECSYCGQPLTVDHIQSERDLLDRERKTAKANLDESLTVQRAAAGRERELLAQLEAKTPTVALAQQEIIAATRRQNTADKERKRSADACADAWSQLSETVRRRISPLDLPDWLDTTYPTRQDLDVLARRQTELKAEDGGLERDLKAGRTELESHRKQLRELESQQQKLTASAGELRTAIAKQQTLQDASKKALAATQAELPESWRDRAATASVVDLAAWEAEFNRLQADGVEEKAKELARAREIVQEMQRQQEEIDRQATEIPAEARVPMEQVRPLIAAARKREAICNEAVLHARGNEQQLRQRREARRKLEEQRKEAVSQGGLYGVLAEALGPDKLQRYVMRHAEQSIVCSAGQILDRLSGGKLALRLKSDEQTGRDKKALVLEAIKQDAVGQQVHPVDMLSGSERFRVAVSLALAIGEYAGRQHRPIQSVIIDEGFGCLDPANSHLMIQELHNLQGQLKQIVLVSHQDEFASAFTNGYRFRLENGGTRVRRYPE